MLTTLLAAIVIAQAAPTAAPARPAPTARPAHRNYQPNVYINADAYLPSPRPSTSPKPKPKNTMKSAAPKQDVFETHQTQF